MNEETKKENNLRKILIIVIIIVLIVVSVIGIILCKDFTNKNEKNNQTNKTEQKNEKEENKVTVIDVNAEVVQKNLEKLMIVIGYYKGAQEEYFKSEKVTNTSLDNSFVFSTIATYNVLNKHEITESEFEEKVKEYFGDYKYEHQDYSKKICSKYRYDSENKKYIDDNHPSCGGAGGPHHIVYKVTKAELDEDELILNIKVLFPGEYGDNDSNGYAKYYSDAARTNAVSGLTYGTTTDNKAYIPIETTDSNFEKGGAYKLIMKKYKDDIYSFVSSEPLK